MGVTEVPEATQGTAAQFSTHSTRCTFQSAAPSVIDALLLEPRPTPATILVRCWEEVREAKECGGAEGRTISVSFPRLRTFPFPSPDS